MLNSKKTENYGLSSNGYQWLLAVVYLAVVALWSAGIAFNDAPDESTHFYLLEYLNAYHALPAPTEPSQAFTGSISGHTWQPGDFWYHGLPFPHVLGAIISLHSLSWLFPSDLAYLAARSFNWILAGVFICALFRICRTAGMSNRMAALGAAIVCAIPQVTFVFSYFNSDAYGLVSVALLLSSLLGFLKRQSEKNAAFLGAALGLMFLAKLYLWPALVFVLLMLAVNQYLEKSISWKRATILIFTALVVSTPMLLVTYTTYNEISGISGQIDFVAMHKSNPAAGYGTCYLRCADQLINLQNFESWITLTLMSYFSTTGWMNIFIPAVYYLIAAVLFTLLLIIATVKTMFSFSENTRQVFFLKRLLPLIMMLGLFPSIIVLSLLASQNSLPQPQGRYLFVTIPFIALLIAVATSRNVFDADSTKGPESLQSSNISLAALTATLMFMTWTNAVSWRTNTLTSSNFPNSAIGQGAISALEKSGVQINSVPSTLGAEHFAERLSIKDNVFYLKALQPTFIGATGSIDDARKTSDGFYLRGWSLLEQANGTAQYVIAVEAGKVVGALKIERKRPDVAAALNTKSALFSGYEGFINTASLSDRCGMKLYTVSSTLEIFAMPDVCPLLSHSSHQ